MESICFVTYIARYFSNVCIIQSSIDFVQNEEWSRLETNKKLHYDNTSVNQEETIIIELNEITCGWQTKVPMQRQFFLHRINLT